MFICEISYYYFYLPKIRACPSNKKFSCFRSTPTENLETLSQRIVDECDLLRMNRALIKKINMRRYTEIWIQKGGQHVEGNLKYFRVLSF